MSDISVFRDRAAPTTWIVEVNDADGDSAVSAAIFEGYQAELGARAYANWLHHATRLRGRWHVVKPRSRRAGSPGGVGVDAVAE